MFIGDRSNQQLLRGSRHCRILRVMNHTSESAKQFLLAKLAGQGDRDGVGLDDVEKRMFFFSEISGEAGIESREAFEKNYDESRYEAKITKLLRRAYARDKRSRDKRREWSSALNTLRHEDFYGLVMIDQAGIPRGHQGEWQFYLEQLPFDIFELGIIALGFLVVFRPSVLHLDLPVWIRWLAYPLFVWLVWYVGRVWQKMQYTKAVKHPGGSSR